MKLVTTEVPCPMIIYRALKLKPVGKLKISPDNLIYLDIDDDYIHQLHPLLPDPHTTKPDYFGENLIGAHISVIYPEENTVLEKIDLGNEHSFKIKQLFSAILSSKRYYALSIFSPSILQLRKKYCLPPTLLFKNHSVDLHITIGVRSLIDG